MLCNGIPRCDFKCGQIQLYRIVARRTENLAGIGGELCHINQLVDAERPGNDNVGLKNGFFRRRNRRFGNGLARSRIDGGLIRSAKQPETKSGCDNKCGRTHAK